MLILADGFRGNTPFLLLKRRMTPLLMRWRPSLKRVQNAAKTQSEQRPVTLWRWGVKAVVVASFMTGQGVAQRLYPYPVLRQHPRREGGIDRKPR